MLVHELPKGRAVWLAVVVAGVALIAGCSSSEDPSGESATETTSTSTTTTLASTTTVTPSSSTTATSTSSSTTTTLVPADPDALVDSWDVRGGDVLTFEEDGSYGAYVELGDEPFDTGTYTFDGLTLVMTGATDSNYCSGEVGSYTVVFPDELTADIEVIEDPCGQRRNSLTWGLIRHETDS